ncbi:MAG: hypothetical protein ACFFB0_04145 [Promethearchaeota archaeon]
MNNNKKALLLIGSPKVEKSTSASLGNYLISKLEKSGMSIEKGFIYKIINREEKIKELFKMIDNTDLIILSFPLYIDCLPAPVIKAMELIKEGRDNLEIKNTPSLMAICNNGFPESSQNMIALQICRVFSKDCGFAWKGGIPVGGGGAINGAPLKKRKGMVRNIIKGLDIAAKDLANGREIPQKAINIISKKVASYNLYRIFANLEFRFQLNPILLTGLITLGLILLISGTPLTIYGIIIKDMVDLNIGIACLIIGGDFFIYGMIFRINIKKKKSI